MNRGILFRGKTVDNGKWIEGYYARSGGCFFILKDNGLTHDGFEMFEVASETVCQYAGLTDKNGRRIFEGDILEVCTFGFNPERFVTEIIYDKCAFRFKNGRNIFYYGQSDFTKTDDAKVIGNIFDNPDLIGDQP